jgi:UDP-N-acetylmuramoylalanine--D-glutamate ligase
MSARMHAAGPDVAGRRVLVYSLGIEGRDLARWLVARGASVVMSDTRDDAALAAAGAAAPAGVERVATGGDLLDPEGFDLVATSQSILRHSAPLVRARELGIPVVSQMQLFLQLCPGRVIGITGSSGKSTTTALVTAMARAGGVRHIAGGNIGEPLLGRIGEIDAGTLVIIEISHTQLQYTDRSPAIAAVTNVTPNHLDQFSWPEYVELKRQILAYQAAGDIAVLNADDPVGSSFAAAARGRVARTSIRGPVSGDGAWLDGGTVRVRCSGREQAVFDRGAIRLRGEHNVANAVMACAIASAAGIGAEAMAEAVAAFRGVPHRLEVVGVAGGATWVNDSIATSPERTMAGVAAFHEPVVLLLGGREKQLPLDELREMVRHRCRAVVCFGEAGQLFFDAMAGSAPGCQLVGTLDEAVTAAASLAEPGDVVLLAPAGTSFDAYPNFEARGDAFRRLVQALPGFEEAQ